MAAGTHTFISCAFVTNATPAGSGGAINEESSGSLLKLVNCAFLNNWSGGHGGAVRSLGALNCYGSLFHGNRSYGAGGAIIHEGAGIVNSLSNCAFIANSSHPTIGYHGGAIYFAYASANTLRSCTFFRNACPAGDGGAIKTDGALAVINCIFWKNNAGANGDEIYLYNSTLNVGYSCLNTGAGFIDGPGTKNVGAGVIYTDPLFASEVDPCDVHLKSKAGRWHSGWVFDGVMSPCIDAGDPASDWSLEPRGNGRRINLGSYGNTPEASRTTWVPDGAVLMAR
jgi:hypothetical protein